jgi:4-hydroxybenzoate polyprenyltransferase
MAILFALVLMYLMYAEWYAHQPLMIYFLLLVIAPLFFFIIKAYDAEKPKDYKLLSLLLKVILFTGIGSIIWYPQLLTLSI